MQASCRPVPPQAHTLHRADGHSVTRRLALGLVVSGAALTAHPLALMIAHAEPEPSSSDDASRTAPIGNNSTDAPELIPFANPLQQYSLQRPAGWKQVDKAGADSLFENPDRRGTNLGVTVCEFDCNGAKGGLGMGQPICL
jgi:hypothetical protein